MYDGGHRRMAQGSDDYVADNLCGLGCCKCFIIVEQYVARCAEEFLRPNNSHLFKLIQQACGARVTQLYVTQL